MKNTHSVISYSQPCEKKKSTHTSTTPQAALKVGRGKVVCKSRSGLKQ